MQRFILKARHLRHRQTSSEGLLWQALRNRKLARWKFRRQHPIDRFIADFVCLDAKLVIEVEHLFNEKVEPGKNYPIDMEVALVNGVWNMVQARTAMLGR